MTVRVDRRVEIGLGEGDLGLGSVREGSSVGYVGLRCGRLGILQDGSG